MKSKPKRSPYQVLFPLIREHLWIPDGKPPAAWSERREGSVLKALLRHKSVSQVEVAILGLARLRDTGQVEWLAPKAKVTCLALYHTRCGVMQMFEKATTEYWRTVKRTPKRSSFQRIGEILVGMSQKYREHMDSEEWRATRKRVLARAMMRCERCNAFGVPLEVHHLTYERFGKERDDDLQALCRDCHVHADDERRSA